VSAAVVLLVGCLVVSWGSFRRQEL
jgi:hypothetical protein